jgi:hypothetical protein
LYQPQAYRATEAEYLLQDEFDTDTSGDSIAPPTLSVTKALKALKTLQNAGYTQQDLCFGAIALDHQDLCASSYGGSTPMAERIVDKIQDCGLSDNLANKEPPEVVSNISCAYGDLTASRYLLVIGDSHVGMLMPALNIVGKHYGYKVLVFWGSGRNFHLSLVQDYSGSPYAKILDMRLQHVLELEKNASATIISFVQSGNRADDYSESYYNGMLDFLPKLTHKPIIIEDVPNDATVSDDQSNTCFQTGEQCTFSSINYDQNNTLTRLKTALPDAFHILPMRSRYCRDDACYLTIGGIPVYTDDNHITHTYSITLAPYVGRQIEQYFSH